MSHVAQEFRKHTWEIHFGAPNDLGLGDVEGAVQVHQNLLNFTHSLETKRRTTTMTRRHPATHNTQRTRLSPCRHGSKSQINLQ
jgi:hypothetical protein